MKKFFLRVFDVVAVLSVVQSVLFLYLSIAKIMYVSDGQMFGIVLLAVLGRRTARQESVSNDSQKK